MTDTELIQAVREEIRYAIRHDREATIKDTLRRLKLDIDIDDEISQSFASRILSRTQVERGIADESIRYREVSYGSGKKRIYVSREDIMRLKSKHRLREQKL